MKITIEIEPAQTNGALKLRWISGYEIHSKIQGNEVSIKANKEGLESLAAHLMALAQESINPGHHLHLDSMNSLEDGSCELIFERMG
jgi:hypothetical protein